MSGPLILFVGVIYAYCAVDLYSAGKEGLGLAFAGYALANVGLWKAAS